MSIFATSKMSLEILLQTDSELLKIGGPVIE
jgi:hypothetical protein